MNRRLVGFAVGVLTAIGAAAWFTGCSATIDGGGGGGGGNAALRLSSSKLNPGQFLTLSHDGIQKGIPLSIEFNGPGGYAVTVLSHDVQDGSARVAVPAFVDFAHGTIGPGSVTVSIQGLEGEATLQIEDLPPLAGVDPGAVLVLFLRAAIDDYQKTIDNLTTIEAEFESNETAMTRDALTARIQQLEATLSELQTTGQLIVHMDGVGPVVVSADWLRVGDRLLVSMLADLDDLDGVSAKEAVARRSINECIPTPPQGLTTLACIQEVLAGIPGATHPWVKVAGKVATGVGLVIAGFAAVEGSAVVALPALLVSVMGGVIGFGDAALEGKNTDAFLQNDGEGFNAGQEILSQMTRVLISAGSTAAEGLENWISDAATWLDHLVTGADAYAGLKCSDNSQQKSRQPLFANGGFCPIVRPPGCDNRCTLAFDGLCDDGGTGSFDGICALGTDCVDCGPRGATDGGVPDAFGACCETSGSCTLVTQALCTIASGTYNAASTTCSPNPCPQPPEPVGACCVSGVCSEISASACAALQGGVYSGDGTTCATVECAAPAEYLVWYTGNVSCWGAPLIYIDTRDAFNQPAFAANYPGGGIDSSVPLVKTELQGGFASVEEARAWICPQFVSRFSHAWCSSYYQTANCNWQPGALGCDLSALPFTDALPAGTSCP